MFTGIVQGVATVAAITDRPGLRSFELALPEGFDGGLALGASVACDGVCLTVTSRPQAGHASFDVMQHVVAATVEMLPSLGRLRLLRQWAGIVDVVQDSSPIIGATPVPGLYINCGWGTGGFKAIPVGGWTLAHVLATGRNHELAEPFQLSRFHTGRLVDEAAAAGIAH